MYKSISAEVHTEPDQMGGKRYIGLLSFRQKVGGITDWTPPEDYVADIAKLLVHRFDTRTKDYAAWHETYLESIKYDKNSDEWVVTIVEPSVN